METIVEVETITETDVLYIGQQIHRDLQQIRKAYKSLVSEERVADLYDAILTFLIENAVDRIGFSIYDPNDENLVYHEWTYKVLRGEVLPENLRGTQQGKGGQPVPPVSKLPHSAIFTSWITWSDDFIDRHLDEQKKVVDGTGWGVPGEGTTFKRRFRNAMDLNEQRFYVSGELGVQVQVYKEHL